jgi:hypothetical protein
VGDELIPQGKTSGICYDYQKGMCSRLNCRFVHEGAPDAMAGGMPQPGMMPMNPGMGGPMGPMGGMPMNPPMGGGGPGVCYDWQKGICSRVNCRFAHGDAGGMPPQGGFAPQQGGFGGGGGRGICYDWQKGVCNRAACRFAHGEEQPGQGGGFGGGPGGGGGLKPGDWLCPGCNFHNFASRVQCFKCYAPVPMDAPIGFNPTNGPGGFMPGYGQQPGFGYGGAPPPNVRPGDWSCPQCNMVSGAQRAERAERAERAQRSCPSTAEAGKRGGWRGHERSECEGDALLQKHDASAKGWQGGLLFCGRSGQNRGLSGGDPPSPPRSRRGRT